MRQGTKKLLLPLLFFVLVWLGAKFLLPLTAPFLLGGALALAAEPMTGFLRKHLRLPRGVCSGISVSAAFCFLAVLLLLLCAFAVRELRTLAQVLPDLEQTARSGMDAAQTFLLGLADKAPGGLRPLVRENVATLFSGGSSLVDRGIRRLLSLAGNLLSHVPDSALTLGTAVISGCMISARLPRIRRWLRCRIPRQKLEAIAAAAARLRRGAAGWLAAQCKLTGVTAVILLLGFVLLRIPYAPLWALAVCLVDAFPVLGTGTVLLPWAGVLFLQHDTARAVGLLGIYATVTLSRSILEPKLLGRHLGLDPLVTLAALYAGYKLWGITGMILAPLLAVTASQLAADRHPENGIDHSP